MPLYGAGTAAHSFDGVSCGEFNSYFINRYKFTPLKESRMLYQNIFLDNNFEHQRVLYVKLGVFHVNRFHKNQPWKLQGRERTGLVDTLFKYAEDGDVILIPLLFPKHVSLAILDKDGLSLYDVNHTNGFRFADIKRKTQAFLNVFLKDHRFTNVTWVDGKVPDDIKDSCALYAFTIMKNNLMEVHRGRPTYELPEFTVRRMNRVISKLNTITGARYPGCILQSN